MPYLSFLVLCVPGVVCWASTFKEGYRFAKVNRQTDKSQNGIYKAVVAGAPVSFVVFNYYVN